MGKGRVGVSERRSFLGSAGKSFKRGEPKEGDLDSRMDTIKQGDNIRVRRCFEEARNRRKN